MTFRETTIKYIKDITAHGAHDRRRLHMTQDQVIQMLHNVVAENQNFTTWTVSTPHLVALVHHAIAKEREAYEHDMEVLMNALWKACGDDEEVVNATIESQGTLTRARGQT